MAINPNDLENIKIANETSLEKERVRDLVRTPNTDENRNGKYPMVFSQEFIGGHKITFDSTPGYRVLELAHGSGTHWQIAEDGKETKIIVGNSHQHYKEGVTITIDECGDILISGHSRISIGGGCHVEVKGDVDLITGGDFNHYVGGNYNLVVMGQYNIQTQKDTSFTSGKGFFYNARENYIMKVTGTATFESGGNMTQKAPRIDLNP